LEYITIYSNLVMDPLIGDEEDEDDNSDPFTDEEEDEYDSTPGEGEGGEDGESEPEAVETNNGQVNVNTAPLPVLKALMEERDLSYSVIDEVGEYRNLALEAYERSLEEDDWSLDDSDESDEEGEEGEGEQGEGNDEYDDEEEEDFIFRDPLEVFDRVEEYNNTDFNLDKDVEAEFTSLLSVTSNVFTIYIKVLLPESQAFKTYRAVVWRRSGSTGESETEMTGSSEVGGQIVVLVPLEEYNHPLPYREGEEEEMDENFDYSYY
jgi:hypothetical protein